MPGCSDTASAASSALSPPPTTSTCRLAEARENEDFETAIYYWRQLIRANPASSSSKVYRSNIVAAENILKDRSELVEQQPRSTDSPQISVRVSLTPGLELPPHLRVFIAARDARREGIPPLAVVELKVGDLPASVLLNNSSAVGPFNLSSAEAIFVSALVSREGVANPQSGDYRIVSETMGRDGSSSPMNLIIAEQIL